MQGAVITIMGALITIGLNIILVPKLHYLGAALATFFCYFFMMITSYLRGQKYYPIPYAKKKLIAYLIIVAAIYLTHRGLVMLWDNPWFNIGTATILLAMFVLFIGKIEKKELEKLPYVRRFFAAKE